MRGRAWSAAVLLLAGVWWGARPPIAAGAGETAGDPGPLDAKGRPRIEKLGTIDCDLVETTPIVWKDRLYRFEWVRKEYRGNTTGKPYFRLVDHDTGEPTAPFAEGRLFGSAFVDGSTVYATGTSSEEGWTGRRVEVFASRDLRSWESWTALDLPGFGICNTSIARADGDYVLMFEIHKPAEEAGVPFTARFARSKDLRDWKLTPPECVYAKDRYTAPHCLRYQGGWFYDFYLEAFQGYQMRVVRSRDLRSWDPSPLNPVLEASEVDRKVLNPRLTKEERERIARARNINNSDIDFCEFRGRLVINYSWGNQEGVEHLAEAVYRGTEAQFLRGWFPAEVPKPAAPPAKSGR
jgi:hypothetical protein